MHYITSRMMLFANVVMFGFFLGMGIWCHTDYEKARALTRSLQWTVCNTTAFFIDQASFHGILTIQVESPSKCIWPQIDFFQCAGPDSQQCLRDNTNRFNNHAWSCVVHINQEQAIDCAQLVWPDWPNVTQEYQNGTGQYIFFACAGVMLIMIIVMLRRARFQPSAEDGEYKYLLH